MIGTGIPNTAARLVRGEPYEAEKDGDARTKATPQQAGASSQSVRIPASGERAKSEKLKRQLGQTQLDRHKQSNEQPGLQQANETEAGAVHHLAAADVMVTHDGELLEQQRKYIQDVHDALTPIDVQTLHPDNASSIQERIDELKQRAPLSLDSPLGKAEIDGIMDDSRKLINDCNKSKLNWVLEIKRNRVDAIRILGGMAPKTQGSIHAAIDKLRPSGEKKIDPKEITTQLNDLDTEINTTLGGSPSAKLVAFLEEDIKEVLAVDFEERHYVDKRIDPSGNEYGAAYPEKHGKKPDPPNFPVGVDLQLALGEAERVFDWFKSNSPDSADNFTLKESIETIRAIFMPKLSHVEGNDISQTERKSMVAAEEQSKAGSRLSAGPQSQPAKKDRQDAETSMSGEAAGMVPGSRLRAWSRSKSRTSEPNPSDASVTGPFPTEQVLETQKAQEANEVDVARGLVKEAEIAFYLAYQIMGYAGKGIGRNEYFKKRAFSLMAKMTEELKASNPKEIMGKRLLIENQLDELRLAMLALETGDQTSASRPTAGSVPIQRAESDEDPMKRSGQIQSVQKVREEQDVDDFVGKNKRILEYVSFVLENAPNDIGNNNELKASAQIKIKELKEALDSLGNLTHKEGEYELIDSSVDYLLTAILQLTNGDQVPASRSTVVSDPMQRAESVEESVKGSEQPQAAQKARAANMKRQLTMFLEDLSKKIEEEMVYIGNNEKIKAAVDKKTEELRGSMMGMQGDDPLKNYGVIQKQLGELNDLLAQVEVAGAAPASDSPSNSASTSSAASTSTSSAATTSKPPVSTASKPSGASASVPSVESTSEPAIESTPQPSVESTLKPSVEPASQPPIEPTSQQGPESFEEKVKRHEAELQQQKLDAYEQEFKTAEEGMWLNHLRTQLQMLVEFCKEMNRIAAQAI